MAQPAAVTARIAAAAGVTFLFLACSDRQPSGPTPAAPSVAVQRAPAFSLESTDPTSLDQHLVLVNDSIPADFDIQVASLGGAVVAMYPEIGVAVTAGLSDTAAAQLAQASFVSGIARDQMVQWVPGPEDFHLEAVEATEPSVQTNQSGAFFFSFWQWNIRQVAAADAWLTTNQGAGTRVAILDTGTDPGHLDLIGKVDLAASRSFVVGSPCGPADDADILDRHFHGTFVSAIVTSRGIGMASVAPDARIIAVKVLSCSGGGSFAALIGGIVYAADIGADVINMSLGAYFPKSSPGGGALVAALNRATTYATEHGAVLVAAAGNDTADVQHDQNFVFLPAQAAHVISVGATSPTNQANFDDLAPYTDFGISGVDLMAPGGNPVVNARDGILSACSRFSRFFPSCAPGIFYLAGGRGTSFAAPHVAGAAAVVKSQFPGYGPDQIRRCLYKGADDLGRPGTDQLYSHGRLNVLGAAGC